MNTNHSVIVEIEGKRFDLTPDEFSTLDCVQINEDTWHLLENGNAHIIRLLHADPTNKKYTLQIDGQIREASLLGPLDILIEKMGLNTTGAKKLSILKAPMPGMVTGIKTKAGDEVEKGTPLLILEAMKMENVIVAPHHAVIKTIHVSIGQAIDKGTVLIEFS